MEDHAHHRPTRPPNSPASTLTHQGDGPAEIPLSAAIGTPLKTLGSALGLTKDEKPLFPIIIWHLGECRIRVFLGL